MKKNLSSYLISLLIMISLVGIYGFFIAESKGSTPCLAKDGILNLENWNWSRNEIIEINGEWEFYPNLLKGDLNFQTPSLLKIVPHYWESDPVLNFSPYGFATYRVKVTGLKPSEIYGLEILDEVTAYTLFANNKRIASTGTVNKERWTYVPQLRPTTSVFQADESGEVQLVMEIANFDYYRGGFWNSIKMGNVEAIFVDGNKNKVRDMFFFATIFIVGFFNMGLFFTYKRNKMTLYFAFFCFSMSFTTLLTGQRLISDMTSIFNWYTLVRLEFLLGYLLLPLFGLFIIHLFEVKAYLMMKRFFEIFIICCFIFTLIMPNYVYSIFIEPYKWGAILFGLYFVYLIGRSIKKRQAGAMVMFFAVFGMMVSIFQEIFIRGPVSWLPYGSLNFVICFSLITLQHFLNIIRKNEMLEMKVMIDPLTGLYNRTYLMEMEENYIYEQQSKNTNLLFLDLDRFKYINDTYGHKIGDFILRETGQRLRNLLRNKDIICRYGGDEFIIIIITDQLDDIINIANRIIQTIQQPFEKDGNNYHIGVSIGIAMTDANTKNIEALIRSSDEAMYKAKKNGGNQYFCWKEVNVLSGN